MRAQCPRCHCVVAQAKNCEGPNFCPQCHKLFRVREPKTPAWVLGVVTILIANWQILCHR
ncbi:MAG: hypothetical protein LLG00_07250 [Planctomycetaceae bacterium]|nr:hypothetical protein [Planctomycetaceae bacterium]